MEVKTTFVNGISPFKKPVIEEPEDRGELKEGDLAVVLNCIERNPKITAHQVSDITGIPDNLVEEACAKLSSLSYLKHRVKRPFGMVTVVYEVKDSSQCLARAILREVKGYPGITADQLSSKGFKRPYVKLRQMVKYGILKRQKLCGVYHYWSVE